MSRLRNVSINDYINYLFVLYAFLLPISRGGISILTALLFVIWLFSDNFKAKIVFLKSNKVVIYLLAFVAFSALSLLWTDNVSSGIYYIRKYWYYLTILVIATTIEKKYLEYGISAFLTAMLISEILSYGIFFDLWSLKHGSPDFPTPFMHHIPYSVFLAFTSLLLLNRFFYEKNIKLKIFYFSYFTAVTSNLFLNAGRTGQVAFIISLFVLGFLNIKKKLLAFGLILMLVVSVIFTSYQVSPLFKSRINIGITELKNIYLNENYCGSLGLRAGAWIIGSEIFLDNPLFGTGVTNDMNKMREYIARNHTNMDCVNIMPSYHNYFIQTTVRLGLIGLFFYLMIYYNLLKLPIKDKQYSNLTIIFVSVYSISSLFENMFHEQFSAAILALFTGIFIAQNRIENEA